MLGWKARRILALREVRNKALLVTDHDKDNVRQAFDPRTLKHSRRQAFAGFKKFHDAIARGGDWLLLGRGPAPPRVRQNWQESGDRRIRLNSLDSLASFGSDGQPKGRGSQSRLRPSNISQNLHLQAAPQSPANRGMQDNQARTMVQITANNRFEPALQDDAYKEAARISYLRRMSYNPMASSKKDSGRGDSF